MRSVTATVSLFILGLPSRSSRMRDGAVAGDVKAMNPWSTSRCVHLELRVGSLDVLAYPSKQLALALETVSAPSHIVRYPSASLTRSTLVQYLDKYS